MKIIKTIFSRGTFMVLMVVLELLLLLGAIQFFHEKAGWIAGILRFLSVIIVLYIINYSKHLSSDMMWIILIMLVPVPGTLTYILLGANMISSRTFRSLITTTNKSKTYYTQDAQVMASLCEQAPDLKGLFHYISESSSFPFYENTGCDYYKLGEEGFPVMLSDMKKAKSFIFLEYFIIEEGEMWQKMLDILEEKAQAGLDVRVMYDDLGSFTTLSYAYAKKLEAKGIKCVPFNRINPIVGIIMNHRDHRKIMVIDGETAFTGGINLADEYINVKERFGVWKDNVIRVKGEAVWSFTAMFLTHWNALRKTDEDFTVFKRPALPGVPDGYIAPFGETPLDLEITAQNIYMSILNQANDYCYIYTPYLIIDTDFTNALILAAKRGVDVRLITPGIPDKKLIYAITRSYYRNLLQGGVKIYEYTPGFVHAKVFCADDRMAVVGTINLDYRSLYLHFENGVFLYDVSQIADIKADFQESFARSREVGLRDRKFDPVRTFIMSVIRLFAPLM